MKRVVVISGAGISAESGLKTFRGADGHWRGYRPEEVACPEAWRRNPGLVLDFYNERRRAVREAQPNAAHRALVELERSSSAGSFSNCGNRPENQVRTDHAFPISKLGNTKRQSDKA